jgi:hypothetical protein
MRTGLSAVLLGLALLAGGCAHLLVPAGKCPFPAPLGSSGYDLPDVDSTECKMVCLQARGHVGACHNVGPQEIP